MDEWLVQVVVEVDGKASAVGAKSQVCAGFSFVRSAKKNTNNEVFAVLNNRFLLLVSYFYQFGFKLISSRKKC